jgi:hypothetical protein
VFHLRHEILEDGIGDIADKEVTLAVLGLEKLPVRIRGFRYEVKRFGVLGMDPRIRGIE